ncbi:hypothetical protein ABZO31_21445 [Streptomyces sp. HUAS MG47]|uniref:hypothetical protein n=1 Tax=Streptomyces solicamelliae TaxID=3231716 RepID=UPI0038780AA9
MDLSEDVMRFARSASFEQARGFMAACSERAGAVAFWAYAESTGRAAPEAWFRAMELLWEPGPVDFEEVGGVYGELQESVDGMSEQGDALDELDELAAEAIDVAHTALGVVLGGGGGDGGDSLGATQVALTALDFAAGLGERAGRDLAARDQAAQERDIQAANRDGQPDLLALRAAAAEDGRYYMGVAAAWQRATAGPPPGPALRVTATVDRSAVLAKYAHAVPRYGVVGRVVEGRDAGGYIRVDRLADHPEAMGVMIRVARDPGVTVDVRAEWVEDWPAVEESLERDGHRIDWPHSAPRPE